MFYGDLQVLWDVSFEVNEGEIVALVGANGAGKSTTLKTISGLLSPTNGRITFLNQRLDQIAAHRVIEHGVVQVPEGRRLFPEMTVRENLIMGSLLSPGQSQAQPDHGMDFCTLSQIARARKTNGWDSLRRRATDARGGTWPDGPAQVSHV